MRPLRKRVLALSVSFFAIAGVLTASETPQSAEEPGEPRQQTAQAGPEADAATDTQVAVAASEAPPPRCNSWARKPTCPCPVSSR